MEVSRQDPPQDLLERAERSSWKIFWKKRNEGFPISYEEAAIKVVEGNSDLAMTPDITSRLNVQDIVRKMKETSQKTRENKRAKTEDSRRQVEFASMTSVSPRKKKILADVIQGTFL